MRIFWFHSGLMPEACEALGYDKRVSCGWLESMLQAILEADRTIELCLLGWDWRPCDIQIGRVRHVSFGCGGKTWYKKSPRHLSDKARMLISEFKPDVIHVQGTEYFYGCFDSEVYNGVPVVVSLQGVISGYHMHYNGELTPGELRSSSFNLRRILKNQSVFNNQRAWREIRAAQEERIIRQHSAFIGRTQWDEDWVRYFNPSARYFSVNENLRIPFFSARRRSAKIKRHSIYCSASASYPLKACHWLLRAVAALKTDYPDIELRIAASKDYFKPSGSILSRLKGEDYHAYLRKLVKKLGIEGHVVALPPISAERVAEELKNAELFVLPSMCENSPNSLGEAMLVGTPSIATFVGGVPSILKDGVEGKLVPSGDPAALAGAIRRWFEHPEEAEAGVETARATALKRHDARTNAEATIAVYRELMRK